uniref:Palmitoyl-protein thioesterase n=1 Tax=Trepomonas sp. PC1 TaxID=1076344 RepID=A0A146K7Z2_9EUKA|eukprot:JAP91706.1 Palmitoyl-protein thioesterase [Trepomonas sp. PC1]
MIQFFQVLDCIQTQPENISLLIIHGVWSDKQDMGQVVARIQREFPLRHVEAVEILSGFKASHRSNAEEYVNAAAEAIKQAAQSQYIDVISHSQGSFVIRNYIQRFSGHQEYPIVNVWISLAGVLNGIFCDPMIPGCKYYTKDQTELINYKNSFLHSKYVSSGYIRDQNYNRYLKYNNTICQLNLECESAQFINNFTSLSRFYAVQSNIDLALIPKSVSTFETFKPNSNQIMKLEEQQIWTKLGLQELHKEGKFKRCYFNEYDHNDFKKEVFHKILVKMIKNEALEECR